MTARATKTAAAVGAVLALATLIVPAGASDAKLDRGRAIAVSKCARCHAVGAAGKSPVALAPPFREIPRRYPVENLAEALAEGIMAHPMMPQFTFDPPEIDALLRYMESLAPRTRR